MLYYLLVNIQWYEKLKVWPDAQLTERCGSLQEPAIEHVLLHFHVDIHNTSFTLKQIQLGNVGYS